MRTPSFPQAAAELILAGPVGPLEVVVDPPKADVTPQPVVAIVCHPLSTEGGTLHNKVVTMAATALRELGLTTVRFNFRSVGGSAGAFDHGTGEQDDLKAVAAWVRAELPQHRLWLVGFSFGAFVSLKAAADLQPEALVSIAPPAGSSRSRRLRTCSRRRWCPSRRRRAAGISAGSCRRRTGW